MVEIWLCYPANCGVLDTLFVMLETVEFRDRIVSWFAGMGIGSLMVFVFDFCFSV